MKSRSFLPLLFSVVMLICVFFLIWYMPAVSERRFQLEDMLKSLETSQGRERKQQHEYEETASLIPETDAELERIIPQSEAAEAEVRKLKQERKMLRKEKEEMEVAASVNSQEVIDHE